MNTGIDFKFGTVSDAEHERLVAFAHIAGVAVFVHPENVPVVIHALGRTRIDLYSLDYAIDYAPIEPTAEWLEAIIRTAADPDAPSTVFTNHFHDV